MFLCPKCKERVLNNYCDKCGYQVPFVKGVHYYTSDDNMKLSEENKNYIGYDQIKLDFDPSLIYWKDRWNENFGVYGACGHDIVNRLGKNITVLDIGCGLGTATIPIAQAGATTIGIDVSKEMLEIAYQRCDKSYDNLYFCKMNAYELMLEDNSIDVVIENAMLHLVDNPTKVYQEIKRVLKPDGLFIHYGTINLQVTDEQKELSMNTNLCLNDIRNHYFDLLDKKGYEITSFRNDYLVIESKYFKKIETIETDYEEVFTELMKFRIHRIEHKALSSIQNIPDVIHKKVWRKTNSYAISKYGKNYKEMKNYSRYKAIYTMYKAL